MTGAPHNWGIVGHTWAVDMLQHALVNQRGAHAYLLSGPRHVGKALLALRLAQALNCETHAADPFGTCRTCRRIAKGNYPDVRIASLQTQGESLKSEEAARQRDVRIDTVRAWLSDINLRPYEGRRRVFILDDVERLSEGAANAMLKALEEPPPYATFVLVAHTAGDIMPTIVSRCQRIKLRGVPRAQIVTWLVAQGVDATHAQYCAAWSDGLPGMADFYAHNQDAVDQLNQRIDEFVELPRKSLNEGFKWAEEWAKTFRAGGQREVYDFLLLWQRWWRDLLLVATAANQHLTWVNRADDLARVARGVSADECAGFLREIAKAVRQLRENTNPQLVFEHLFLVLPNRK